MVKGCRKQTVWLKNTGSEWFEEAYFIVSDSKEIDGRGEKELLKEADRIVSANVFSAGDGRGKGLLQKLLLPLAGIASLAIGLLLGYLLFA